MKKESENNKRDLIATRLDAIIRLLMEEQRLRTDVTLNDQVLMLHSAGLKDTEIGNIIGYERKNVAAIRTKLKKAKKK
jgi:hypothetical protein